RFGHVTLSGGNPALLPQLDELIRLLHARGMQVALETQGSRWQEWFRAIDDLTISPKPPSSGMNTDWNRLDEIMNKLSGRAEGLCLKVVIFDEADLDYALTVHRRYPGVPLVLQVGNDDVGTSDAAGLIVKLLRRYEWLVERVAASEAFRQVRVLPQLHTLLWGNKRGV
ncbi:7-carboxy-7-deazaguanine synthase, partial [Paenibacillus darwinianus]